MTVRIERLQALADGIFAIALTLLVLELPVPAHADRLGYELLHRWPSYAAYVVSFVTVAIVWVNHHVLLDAVRTVDRALLELNLLLLLFVAAVPWPTGLLAEYLLEPRQSSAAAVAYGAVMTAMSTTFTLCWLRLTRTPHLVDDSARPRLVPALRRSTVGPVAYAASTAVAMVSATVAFGLFAAVAAYFALSGRRASVRVVPVHHGVAPAPRDHPPVDRDGEQERHHQ